MISGLPHRRYGSRNRQVLPHVASVIDPRKHPVGFQPEPKQSHSHAIRRRSPNRESILRELIHHQRFSRRDSMPALRLLFSGCHNDNPRPSQAPRGRRQGL